MEKDDEITGSTGSHYTTHFRAYDSRIGRWLSIDPEARSFPWQSPYVAFDNNPIKMIDPKGNSSEETLFDRAVRATGAKRGYKIYTRKSDGSSHILKTDAVIKKADEQYIEFYVTKTRYEINGSGDVTRVEEERILYKVYETNKGRLFTDGDVIIGTHVDDVPKLPSQKKPDLWGKEAQEYVNKYDSVIKEWASLTKERPDIMTQGRAPYKSTTGGEVFDFIMNMIDGFAGTAPSSDHIDEINSYYIHNISKDEMNEAPAKIENTKSKSRRIEVNEM